MKLTFVVFLSLLSLVCLVSAVPIVHSDEEGSSVGIRSASSLDENSGSILEDHPSLGLNEQDFVNNEQSFQDLLSRLKMEADESIMLNHKNYVGDEVEVAEINRLIELAEELERQNECPICYSPIEPNTEIKTACNHVFHKQCLISWYNSDLSHPRTCPCCRRRIENPSNTGGYNRFRR